MSPQPPRTPPSDRNLDRNRFIRYVDREVDRRLRVLETTPTTTVVQQTTTTPTTSTGTTLPGPSYTSSTSYPAYIRGDAFYQSGTGSRNSWASPSRLVAFDTYNDLGYGAGAVVSLYSTITQTASNTNYNFYAAIIDPSHANVVGLIHLRTYTVGTIGSGAAVPNYEEPNAFAFLPGTIFWSGGIGAMNSGPPRIYYKRLGIDGTAQSATASTNMSVGTRVQRIGDVVWGGPYTPEGVTGRLVKYTKSGSDVIATDLNIATNTPSPVAGGTAGNFASRAIHTPVGHWIGQTTGTNEETTTKFFVTDAGSITQLGVSVVDFSRPSCSTGSGFAYLTNISSNALSQITLNLAVPALTVTGYSNLIANEANVTVVDGGYADIAWVSGTDFVAQLLVYDSVQGKYQSRVYVLAPGGSTLVWSSQWVAPNYLVGSNPVTPSPCGIAAMPDGTVAWAHYAAFDTNGVVGDDTRGLVVYRGTLS